MDNSGPKSNEAPVQKLVSHLFRHESGRMVATLTRLFGFNHLETAEHIVHETMYKALTEWPYSEIPLNPAAWMYKVAKNKAIDKLRKEKGFQKISEEIKSGNKDMGLLTVTVDNLFLDHKIQDSQLRMIFSCCHSSLNPETQIALVLKNLCGFSTKEITRGFLSSEETIRKRLQRGKAKIKQTHDIMGEPVGKTLSNRLPVVLKCIYLLFNEGYNATYSNQLIKKDLCLEALRLGLLLNQNKYTSKPSPMHSLP